MLALQVESEYLLLAALSLAVLHSSADMVVGLACEMVFDSSDNLRDRNVPVDSTTTEDGRAGVEINNGTEGPRGGNSCATSALEVSAADVG